MAGKSKKKSSDPLGSIFDFIFMEADKPVDKRKPVKPTGVSAGDTLTDGVLAALEKPGAFISNTIVDEFNGALDITIAEADFNEYGKIKLSTQSLAGFLKDPAGQAKKAADRAKAIRKASRVRMLGEAADDFLTRAWAHKYGDLEAKEIARANASANERVESYKISKALGESVRPVEREVGLGITAAVPERDRINDFMIDRTVELIGQRTFGSSWNSMPEDRKIKFSQFVTKGRGEDKPRGRGTGGFSVLDGQRFVAREFGNREARNFGRALLSFQPDENIDISNPEIYKTLENDHLTGKINSLRNAAPGSPEEKQRKIYEKTKTLVNLRTKKQIRDLQELLRDPNLPQSQRTRIEDAVNQGEMALRLVGGRTVLISTIGKWEGYVNSINNVWGGVLGAQNLVPSVLNGDFFDPGKNTLGPTEVTSKLGTKITVARTGSNKLLNAYNQMGESLYYMTPRSLFKTFLVNGEGFGRIYLRQSNALMQMGSDLGGFGAGFDATTLINNMDRLVGRDLNTYLRDALDNIRTGGALSAVDFGKLEKLLKSSKNFRNLTHVFSFPSRLNAAITSRLIAIIAPQTRKMRRGVVRMFLKNKSIAKWVRKTGGGKLLRSFIQSGGFKNLVKPLVTAISGALGVAFTPLVGFLTSIVTGIVIDLAMKMGKILLQLGAVILIGIVAVVVVGFGGARRAWRKFNKRTYSYNYVVPGTVNTCSGYDPGVIIGPGPGPGGPEIPTDCTGGESVYDVFKRAREYVNSHYGSVSTNLVLVDCPGHYMCSSIGWAWCYSSDNIYCKADKLGGASCEYIFELSVHELIHQVQGWGDCNTDMREWGADYLSNNGGNYTFLTTSGCKKATQVSTAGCTAEEAKKAALCWETNTTCFKNIRSQIISRFCN